MVLKHRPISVKQFLDFVSKGTYFAVALLGGEAEKRVLNGIL